MYGKIWTQQEIDYLTASYHNTSTRIIAEKLGCSLYGIYNKAYGLGLRKDTGHQSEIMKKRWRENPNNGSVKGCFKKGQVSHNKGKPMPANVYERAKSTMFKPGQVPHNAKPVGYECLRKDKNGRQYWLIKLEGVKILTQKHRWLWEQAHGKIPKGYNIQFKDGNTQNCTLDNLYIISRKEQMIQNSYHYNYSPEIQKAIHTIGVLNRHINKQLKNTTQ